MSRWVEYETKIVKEEIKSMDECRFLLNEVCCNDNSDEVMQYVDPEFCLHRCPHFIQEDGVIVEPDEE